MPHSMKVTMHGKPLKLSGNTQKVGDIAPDFSVMSADMSEIKLSDFKGKVVVINSVPSVDTSVCDLQIRRFNQEASNLKGVQILSISVDLPFALERYCGAKGIDKVKTTSDHKNLDFGKKYGLVIDDLRLLSRAVIVIDKKGVIKYIEYVSEVSHAPDFDKALEAVKSCI